jgi:hypothetical protein
MARVLDLVAQLGGVDAVFAAVERGSASTSTRVRAAVPFRHAGDVLDAFDRKLVTAEEARRLLGRPARKPARTRPRVVGSKAAAS